MPATPCSCFTRSRAFVGVSTSSAIISFLFVIFFCMTTHRGFEVCEAFTMKNLQETFIDLLCDTRSLVNEASVQLHETRARRDLFPCVFRGEDAAHADQWDASPRQFIQQCDHTCGRVL